MKPYLNECLYPSDYFTLRDWEWECITTLSIAEILVLMDCEDDKVIVKPCTNFLDLPTVIISEIFRHLGPKELSQASCVCTLFFKLSLDCLSWKDFYCNRWQLPHFTHPQTKTWRELYMDRHIGSRAFMGSYRVDTLYGHMEGGVRTVCIVSCLNLIITGGYDRIVKIWNLEEALPIMSSRPLDCIIRDIEADAGILVVGGDDSSIRCWRAATEGISMNNVFDICKENCEIFLWGHTGPVICLGLDGHRIYSGSWDMSIRVWDRETMKCVKVLMHMDWVWSLVVRGPRVFSASGSDVYTWDVESGEQIRVRCRVHLGQAYSVQCSQSGEFLFTGGEDGIIHMFDDRSAPGNPGRGQEEKAPLASWVPHSGPIYSLAFEDPWLVSASGDGKLAVMDVRKHVISTSDYSGAEMEKKFELLPKKTSENKLQHIESPQRMFHGFLKNLFSVDIGAERIVCGGEEKFVKIWDFSQALEIERRVQASRIIQFDISKRKKKPGASPYKGKQPEARHILAHRSNTDVAGSRVWQKGNHRNKIKVQTIENLYS